MKALEALHRHVERTTFGGYPQGTGGELNVAGWAGTLAKRPMPVRSARENKHTQRNRELKYRYAHLDRNETEMNIQVCSD